MTGLRVMQPAEVVAGGYHPIALPLAHGLFMRYVYAKKHLAKESGEGEGHGESLLAADRTVYIVNLPPASDDAWLKTALSAVGAVQHIVPGPGSGHGHAQGDGVQASTAHVVFKSKTAAESLLRIAQLDCELPEERTGLQAYLARYHANKPGMEAVKEIADRFMATFDQEEEEELLEREELKNQVDDDGFITVVTNKRKKAVPEDLMPVAKKQKPKELQNFYRFQMREKKRDQLKSLRERFEEDRELVEKLRKANKFRPE